MKDPVLIRWVAAVLLLALVILYGWLTLRTNPRVSSLPFLPSPVSTYFDLNPLSRNFPAFALLGVLAASVVAGLDWRWQLAALCFCLIAPVLKDVAQLFTLTRHFNWQGTLLGVLGAAVGWGTAAALLLRGMKSE